MAKITPEIVYIVYEISGEYDDYEKIVRYAFYNHDLAEKCVKLLQQQEEERVKFEAELYELTGTYNEYTHGLSYRYFIDTLAICDADDEEDDETEEL